MNIKTAIQKLLDNHSLSADEMTAVMEHIMSGEATPAQIAGFLIALRTKGETVEEIIAAVKVLRHLATKVVLDNNHLVDIVGTGGDATHTFNISTASAFVVAAAGGTVAKHGNRSVSSSSGSADVLEAAGININLNPEQVAQCVKKLGVGFMFAPMHHSAMGHVVGPRKELGVRTVFNLLGPLTNPAGATHHLIGVYDKKWLQPFGRVLQQLGSEHAVIVHAEDGLDEISIAAKTSVFELKQNKFYSYEIDPQQFAFDYANLADIKVKDAQESMALIKQAFDNVACAARDIIILNAGAAIYAADVTTDLESGINKAREVIANGLAKDKFNALIELSQRLM